MQTDNLPPVGKKSWEACLHDAVLSRLNFIAEEEISLAQKRIETRIKEDLHGVCLKIMTQVDYDRFGKDLRITFSMPIHER